MHLLQKNLVHSSEEARTSDDSDLSESLGSNFFEGLYPSASCPSPTGSRLVKFPPSVSTSAATFCRSSLSSKDTFRSTDLVSRRAWIPLPKKALGFVLNSTQVLHREKSYLPRPHPSFRQRRSIPMGTSFHGDSTWPKSSDSCPDRRQSEWYEAYCQTRTMGPSALPFSFNFEISNPISPPKTRSQGRNCTRRNLPVDSPGSRNSRRISSQRFTRPIDAINSNLLRHSTHPSCSARVSSVGKILSSLSRPSRIKSANDNQYCRIHVLYYSRLTQTQSLCFQSSITPKVDNRFNSIASETKLQWQTSSTDLINPTPICDLKLQTSSDVN